MCYNAQWNRRDCGKENMATEKWLNFITSIKSYRGVVNSGRGRTCRVSASVPFYAILLHWTLLSWVSATQVSHSSTALKLEICFSVLAQFIVTWLVFCCMLYWIACKTAMNAWNGKWWWKNVISCRISQEDGVHNKMSEEYNQNLETGTRAQRCWGGSICRLTWPNFYPCR